MFVTCKFELLMTDLLLGEAYLILFPQFAILCKEHCVSYILLSGILLDDPLRIINYIHRGRGLYV